MWHDLYIVLTGRYGFSIMACLALGVVFGIGGIITMFTDN